MKQACLFVRALSKLFPFLFTFLLMGCFGHQYNYRVGIVDFKEGHYRDAFVRLKPEAYRGQPDAEYAVGFMYYYGFGVNEDRQKALYWIRRAANHDHPLANRAIELLEKEYSCHLCNRPGPNPAAIWPTGSGEI